MSTLWDGAKFKLDMAHFYLDEMRRDLIPATVELGFSYNQQRRTSPPMNRWDPKFYYHLDAFLAATRSVDLVITTTFGIDKLLKKRWTDNLKTLERTKRKSFQDSYDLIAVPFRTHLLTHIRNVSIHRSGTPSVEVAVLGRYGTLHRGGPTQNLSTFEEPQQLTVADPNHPPPIWMNPMKRAIEPGPDDFVVREVLPDSSPHDYPLFPKCTEYLQSASELVDEAKILAEQVHTQPVTPPPLYALN
jgi:hypothetical protein